jgi:hypothetical protein
MKTLFVIAVILFFGITAFAQTGASQWAYAPKTLNCTEQAISFKATLHPGWRVNMFRVGNMAPVNPSFEFMASKPYAMGQPIAVPASLSKFENVFNNSVTEKEDMFKLRSTLLTPKTNIGTERLTYLFRDEKALLSAN